jgi:tRNA wybutosine-synthesizing protein 2
MRARKISREDLPKVLNEEWVDSSRSPFVEGDTAWVPVRMGEPYDTEIPERSRYQGRGYYMTGDVAIVHGELPSPAEIESIVAFRHPRGIVWIESLDGATRTPRTRLVFGEAGEVHHKEDGYTFILDPQKVMFSMGNRMEKRRISALVRSSRNPERVADMFAGIGYFTIPLAGAEACVHAMEINPVAYGYLERNIQENQLTDNVTLSLGDCRNQLEGTYQRIVMGHFAAISMLPKALAHAEAGTVLHIHSIGPMVEQVRQIAEGTGFSSSIEVHTVKKYRPHAWHVVHDVTLA